MKTMTNTKPGFPEKGMHEKPAGALDYKAVYKKTKVLDSGGKDVQTSWQGRTLTTGDMKKIYKGAD